MRGAIDETHDASRRSWVESANRRGCDFPLQNLPLGVFRRRDRNESPRGGVAIGDRVVDVAACRDAGLFTDLADTAAEACADPTLNRLMGLGPDAWSALRRAVWGLLLEGDERIRATAGWRTRLVPEMSAVELLVPATIGDFTDFFSSLHHATNAGRLFRPDQPLLPNYKHVPIAYHGRASSVVVSGTSIRRPSGQTLAADASQPVFGPTRALDYEAELGFFVGQGNELGVSRSIGDAEDGLFGMCLLNDWSARDVQKWEAQPLGPFLAKSFATSISPWIVTFDALAPFRVAAPERLQGDPQPLAYLDHGQASDRSGIDVTIDAFLSTPEMRANGIAPTRLSHGRSAELYWTPGQLLTHHASNGCDMRPGDLLGSGTVSGPNRDNEGCLLELTRGGREPITLPGGETRRFLADGDEVILEGHCEAEGFARIGFGACRGRILPAHMNN